MIEAKITGHIQFGSIIYPHTLYRIEVAIDNENWYVYRRYSEFLGFHKHLVKLKHFNPEEKIFPEKILFSNRYDVINERMSSLQKYLILVLEIQNINNDSQFQTFLDFNLKGKSGVHNDLSPADIIYEIICDVKRGLGPIEIWNTCFVVLTKNGTIYVFQNIYDRISSPLVAYSVSSSIHLQSKQGTKVIELNHRITDQKLFLKLSSDAQLASWLRTLAEFTTRNIPAAETEENPKTVTKPQRIESMKESKKEVFVKSDTSRPDPSKPDELSSLYGV
jgi:hypothetical protein